MLLRLLFASEEPCASNLHPQRETLGPHLLLRDVVGQRLAAGDDVDGGLVLEDVALAGGQHLDDLVLNLLELARVLSALGWGWGVDRVQCASSVPC